MCIRDRPRVDATQQPGDTGRVQNPFFSHLHQAQSAQPNSPHLSAPQHANPIPQRATQTVAANTAPGPRQNYVVAAIITGPRQLKQNKTAEYKITIANQTGVPANNVLMHLAIPPGLKVLAAEPDAHYDQAKRMVSWSIPAVQHGETKVLRYRVQATGESLQKQKGTLQIGQQTIGDTYFCLLYTSDAADE